MTQTQRDKKTIDFYRGFGARIRAARLATGLTEREAAEAIGVTVKRVRQFESGEPFRGGQYHLAKFMRQFEIDPDWLYGGGGPCSVRRRPKLTLIIGGKTA